MKTSMTNLRNKWNGTDAVVHITELSEIYNAISDNIENFQKLIVDYNNDKIRPLQQHIINYCESCPLSQTLSNSIKNNTISSTAYEDKEYVSNSFSTYIDKVSETLTKYGTFLSELESKKNAVKNNLTSGCEITTFLTEYNKFNNEAKKQKDELKTKINQLEAIAANAKKLM